MYCTPTVCWVQPTLYTNAVVRSRPEFSVISRATSANCSGGMPQTSCTSSGVYRAKCRLSTWNTQRGCCSVGSVSGNGSAAAPPEPCASPRAAARTPGCALTCSSATPSSSGSPGSPDPASRGGRRAPLAECTGPPW